MNRTIKWNRDHSGREIEALSDGKPMPALPQPDKEGELSCVAQDWSYKKGTLTFVKILDAPGHHVHRPCAFIDIANGCTISGIPRDSFEFVD